MKLITFIPGDLKAQIAVPEALADQFISTFEPVEGKEHLHLFVDARTSALYSECHIRASKLISLSTTDVPLDPEEQGEYRANRDIVADHSAFRAMKEDAKLRRSFSNIVAEFTTEFDEEHPLKIIGGQHRFGKTKSLRVLIFEEVHEHRHFLLSDWTSIGALDEAPQ